jgi:bacillithiol system protein YtxJ
MGIWSLLFGREPNRQQDKDTNVEWIMLNGNSQLYDIDNNVEGKVQLIYKHSTTCGISSVVLRRLEHQIRGMEGDADLYFLDVHRHREVSNAIADRYKLRHQTPQLLILKQGELVAAASHGAIADLDLKQYL